MNQKRRVINSFPPEKMSVISQTTVSNAFSLMRNLYLIQVSIKFAPKGPVDNTPVLVQVMAWRPKRDKPLSKPMVTDLSDAVNGEP